MLNRFVDVVRSHHIVAVLTCLVLLNFSALCNAQNIEQTKDTKQAQDIVQYENVLGTSLEFRLPSGNSAQRAAIEQAVLSEIDRLEAILSRHNPQSIFMQWQRGEVASNALPRELKDVLAKADQWHSRTKGAFDVRVQSLTDQWEQAAQNNQQPAREQLAAICFQLQQPAHQLTTGGAIQRLDNLPLSLDGLAKGYILDQVCHLVRKQFPGVPTFSINIGGDVRSFGVQHNTIQIVHPNRSYEGADPLCTIQLSGEFGFATSGGYRRFFQIGAKSFSKLIDPRTGWPTDHVKSVSVIAPTATDADAVATAMSVLSVEESLELAESHPGFECLILTKSGTQITSSGWPESQSTPQQASMLAFKDTEKADSIEQPKTEASEAGLFVDFTLVRSGKGRYRRPYVAIWLEDEDAFPVKTAVLWIQTEQPGPRWHRDLTRWYRNDRLRKVAEQTSLIDTISGATRGAGEYKARFDGTDNDGKPLPHGKYTLCIEVAREHGTYQLIRKPVELGEKALEKQSLKGNVEVGEASFQYVPWSNK